MCKQIYFIKATVKEAAAALTLTLTGTLTATAAATAIFHWNVSGVVSDVAILAPKKQTVNLHHISCYQFNYYCFLFVRMSVI